MKPDEQQTDWERRTLGAARWHYEAVTNTWPSASLVAAMSVFDALLCHASERQGKDRVIAKRLREFEARVRGVPTDQLEQWFRNLYGRWRNTASHQARFYLEEQEVERLVELSSASVHWAVRHLDPTHRVPARTCTTLEEAHQRPHDAYGREQ